MKLSSIKNSFIVIAHSQSRIFLLATAIFALAPAISSATDGKKLNLKPSPIMKKSNLPDFSKVPKKPEKETGMAVESTCTTSTGQVHKQGESGFDTCYSESATSTRGKSDREFQPEGPRTKTGIKIGK